MSAERIPTDSLLEELLPSHLQGLNAPQREAVEHFKGPILVLAGAGSGKTRVLTRRVINLVVSHNVPPQQILAVTFTNKATTEMKERLEKLLGERARELWVATFHSTGLRILRRHAPLLSYTHDFVVYDDDDSKALVKSIIKEMALDEKKYTPGAFLRAIDRAKNNFVSPAEMYKNALGREQQIYAEVYDHYQRSLLKNNAMDFGDLLVNVVTLFEKHPEILQAYQYGFQYVLVDEFQDTNAVQYRLLRLLTCKHNNLLVVGDDDQSIYAFRGADISNILHFEQDFPNCKVIKLEQNYRSTATILEAAHAVISKNKARKAKKLWTESAAGSKINTYVGGDETTEAAFVAREITNKVSTGFSYKDIAIFYRTNAQSRALEEALMHKKIPYRIYGGLKFYERKEIRDILAYLRLVINPSDNQAFLRCVNTPPRGIGAQSVHVLANFAKENSLGMYQAAFQSVKNNTELKSKGLTQFVSIISTLAEDAQKIKLGNLINQTIKLSEYEERLKTLKDPTVQSRIENLRELEAIGHSVSISSDKPVDVLRSFLDRVTLAASSELPVEENKDAQQSGPPNVVSLMTLHLAKGLEFPVVFLTGLEEGLLPHYRSIEDPDAVEEERRLCYVGITRAMKQLFLTRAISRGLFSAGEGFGSSGQFRLPSRFAKDLPERCCNHLSGDFVYAMGISETSENSADDDLDYQSPQDKFAAKREKQPFRGFEGVRAADSLSQPIQLDGVKVGSQAKPKKRLSPTGAPLEDPSQITPGLRVLHPYLGKGEVQTIDGDLAGPLDNLKVLVKFDDHPQPKKLVWKLAQLSVLT